MDYLNMINVYKSNEKNLIFIERERDRKLSSSTSSKSIFNTAKKDMLLQKQSNLMIVSELFIKKSREYE